MKQQKRILTGSKEIQQFVGRSWTVIYKWIREMEFPAVKIDGIWESDSELILEWRKRQIMRD
ncbi:MAG: hypothetical protein KJ737_20445 [Proteobacteria bacterium]|nr:hypothetical protein [Pseudomonadota bacterium]